MLSHTVGTNDALTWIGFAQVALSKGPLAGYVEIGPSFNHPLLGTLSVTASLALARVLGFPVFTDENVTALAFFVRLPALAGDLIGTFALAHILASRVRVEHARALTAAYAASPLVALAGLYHGNTDLLWAALAVTAALALERSRAGVAGALLGAALSVKVAALVAVPALAAVAWRERTAPRFAIGFVGAVAVLFLPPLCLGWKDGASLGEQPFVHCVFGYRGAITIQPWPPGSFLGFWGARIHLAFASVAPEVILAATTAWAVACARPGRACEAVAVAIAISLFLAPTFGAQYLAWFALPVFVLGARAALPFHAAAALQAALIYRALHGFEGPRYYASSKNPHGDIAAWPGFLTWAVIGAIIVSALVEARRAKSDAPRAADLAPTR